MGPARAERVPTSRFPQALLEPSPWKEQSRNGALPEPQWRPARAPLCWRRQELAFQRFARRSGRSELLPPHGPGQQPVTAPIAVVRFWFLFLFSTRKGRTMRRRLWANRRARDAVITSDAVTLTDARLRETVNGHACTSWHFSGCNPSPLLCGHDEDDDGAEGEEPAHGK
ncbi:hypothetical protein AAFF_G00272010 [Aldrovandia affinis]|uniref:Uncharacterized protein n=1 Tax=Aldrovandia affinis TaxID=143900 RepID=A0AAD7W2B4_9TELE|nr:hypothetical protein AAFF_G00272010 [Aldrovandia affinis]